MKIESNTNVYNINLSTAKESKIVPQPEKKKDVVFNTNNGLGGKVDVRG